jgi:hypothetical protein
MVKRRYLQLLLFGLVWVGLASSVGEDARGRR